MLRLDRGANDSPGWWHPDCKVFVMSRGGLFMFCPVSEVEVAHPKFELGCAMLILVCAVMIGVEAHWTVEHIGSPEPLTFRILNSIFNLLFTVELILRATVDGLYFWSWSNPSIHWNLMDSVLVARFLPS